MIEQESVNVPIVDRVAHTSTQSTWFWDLFKKGAN